MDIELLTNIVSLTSAPKEEVEEYAGTYLDSLVAVSMASLMEGMDQYGEDEALKTVVEHLRNIEESKSGLNIADDKKFKSAVEDYKTAMQSVGKLKNSEEISKKIEGEIEKLDEQVAFEIMNSCTQEDRDRIKLYIKKYKAAIEESENNNKNPYVDKKGRFMDEIELDSKIFNNTDFINFLNKSEKNGKLV